MKNSLNILYLVKQYNKGGQFKNDALESIKNLGLQAIVYESLMFEFFINKDSQIHDFFIDLIIEMYKEESWTYLRPLIKYNRFIFSIIDYIEKYSTTDAKREILQIIDENIYDAALYSFDAAWNIFNSNDIKDLQNILEKSENENTNYALKNLITYLEKSI